LPGDHLFCGLDRKIDVTAVIDTQNNLNAPGRLRLKFRNDVPESWLFCTTMKTPTAVVSSVVNRVRSLTVPKFDPASIKSPILEGLKMSSMTPAATFDSVPCKAKPIARPAVPSTARKLVV
jgi:hypothetical protein